MIGDSARVRKTGDGRHGQWAHVREIGDTVYEGDDHYSRLTLEFETDGATSDEYTTRDVIDSDTCFRCGVRLVGSLSRSLHEC